MQAWKLALPGNIAPLPYCSAFSRPTASGKNSGNYYGNTATKTEDLYLAALAGSGRLTSYF
ncbi:MAG: hypothetical protein JXA13_04950, partial [Anaerolineales bacterium]|nr:hypothetical protein [Anaerolineales bacterium]